MNRNKLLYNIGQTGYQESRFGFFTRKRMENKVIYSNQTDGKPHFLVAYKIFVDSLAQQDMKNLEKMCEKNFFQNLTNERREMAKENIAYH